jgi:hypothetical protein
MSKTRFLISVEGEYISIPSSEHSRIERTVSMAHALKFVTYERAQQVALSIKDKLPSAPYIVACELPY